MTQVHKAYHRCSTAKYTHRQYSLKLTNKPRQSISPTSKKQCD